jgi:type I restriction enzyme S subunit
MSTRASIGDLSILLTEATTNQGFQSLIAKNDFYNEFLYYLVQNNKSKLIKNSSGSTFLEISPNKVKSIEIPIPPTLEEQKAIATALSDVDELISNLDQLITKKKAIKQGAMQQLLTPPHKGGKRLDGFSGEWEEKKLGEVTNIKTGTRNNQDKVEGGL